jgi:integrase
MKATSRDSGSSLATHTRFAPPAAGNVNVVGGGSKHPSVGPLGLVFPNGRGNIESHANIAARGFAPLQRRCFGQVKYGLHSLRHFFASWAIEQRFTPKRLQALLGHSSIQMTFDTYGHLFPSLEDDHAKFAAGELQIRAAGGGA